MTKTLILAGTLAAALLAGATEETWDVSAADFPRMAGETDDTARLQRAVNATGAEKVLYLPRGVYEISKTIMVTNCTSLLLHKSATVRAVAKMDHLLHVNMRAGSMWRWGGLKPGETYDQGLFLKGGHLDGNGLASCLYLQMYFHFTLRDVVFANGSPYGLHVGNKGAEIIANNLYFRTVKRGLAGNVALFSEGNDSQYSDLVCVDYTTGLRTLGGANTFTRFHVWGGPIPPPEKGRLPEMLENSVCFELGGHMNTLRDCYADTGAIGFLVGGWGQQIIGCWYLNNTAFGLKDITIVKQRPDSSDLLISDGVFRASGPETKLYEGPGLVQWRSMIYRGFAPGTELPAEAICEPDQPQATTPDDWELITDPKSAVFTSPPGEFAKPQTARALSISAPRRMFGKRFPEAGPGKAFVLRVRATDDATKRLEFSFYQTDGKVWGTSQVPLTREWREIRIPYEELHYFSHYPKMPPLAEGETPDARKIHTFRFMYGNWISGGTADQAHGFEIGSLRIVGR